MAEIKAIETEYAGCRFRSRLEARWAVFFDAIGARWEYEPQGYLIDDKPYLPDFRLIDCGTWIEVRGDPGRVDTEFLGRAAQQLPQGEVDPRLMVLGPIPRETITGDWGWIGMSWVDFDDQLVLVDGWFGFGSYGKNLRPWSLGNTSMAPPGQWGGPAEEWLTPVLDPYEDGVPDAYRAARMARFEHGEHG